MQPMTTFQIKLIAITSMVIDHLGLVFFPHILLLRIIGRLAFPLFAWLIANGAYHTSNIKLYLTRLFLFALVAQVPFILVNRLINPSFWEFNVLFTLFFGLAAIELMKRAKNRYIAVSVVIVSALLAQVLSADYGALGVLAIIIFYIFFEDRKKMIILQICLFTLLSIVPILLFIAFTGTLSPVAAITSFNICPPSWISVCVKVSAAIPANFIILNLIEPLGLISLVFIALYDDQEGKKLKYFFYWFYPMHLLILYFIKLFI
jgi:hypothetical protein